MFPIMHLVGMRRCLAEQYPWLPASRCPTVLSISFVAATSQSENWGCNDRSCRSGTIGVVESPKPKLDQPLNPLGFILFVGVMAAGVLVVACSLYVEA